MADIPYDAAQGEDLYDGTQDFLPMDNAYDPSVASPYLMSARKLAEYRDYCQYTRDILASAVIQPVETLTFDPQSSEPTPTAGMLHYSEDGQCMTFVNDKTGSALCIGREGWIRAENNTGVAITNGQIVYIDGADDGLPSVALAQANSYDTSRVIAMCTEASIADGTNGEFTRFGFVNDLNTSAYTVGTQLFLSDTVAGGFTSTEPTGSNFPASIGSVLIQHASTGRIDFTANISHHAAEVNRISGYASYNAQTASFNDGTRTLTITPDDTEYVFYQDGTQYRKTGDTYQIADTEGIHCIYYDGGTLTSAVNPHAGIIDTIIRTKVITQFVGWNATANTHYYLGSEFHGAPNVSGMSAMTHAYLHFVNGGRWISGGALNTMDIDGSGNDDTAAQFGIDTSGIVDEDIPFFPAGSASTAQIPIWYLDGANANIREATELSGGEYYKVLTDTTAGVGSTGRLVFNEFTGGAWQLTTVDDRDFVLCHIFACNDLARPYIAIIGQGEYDNKGDARDGAQVEILSLTTGALPTPEFVPFATVIFETRNSYNNDVKGRVVSTGTGADYVDWRYSERTGGSGGSGGSETFDGLSDTPATKVGAALQVVRVNAGETALEYATLSGSGDVSGPASAVDENIAVFNGVTGKIIEDAGINKSAITANTAKVTNATHTGDVTGSGALTVASVAITGQSAVTADDADYVLISDTSDSGNLKKALASDFGGSTNTEQSVSYSATIAPDLSSGNVVKVGALTGSITVNNPSNATTAEEVYVRFVQDGTGGRTVTLGSDYVLLDSNANYPVGANEVFWFSGITQSDGTIEGGYSPVTSNEAVELTVAVSDETTDLTTGTAKLTFRMPYAMTLTEVRANVNTAPTDATIVVDINDSGTTVLSTKLSIDASEKTSTTAATAPVISDSALADDAEITIDIDQIGSTVAGKGLKVTLIGTRA